MIDLCIVNPSSSQAVYGSLANAELTAKEPPVWARLIAGYARDKGYNVQILDAEALDMMPGEVGWRIEKGTMRPRLLCIVAYGHQPSASTQQMGSVNTLARICKTANQYLPIVVVGGHVSALPDLTLEENEHIDFVCSGEGPVTIVQLIEWIRGHRTLRSVEDLVWRDGKDIVHNKPAKLLSVDELHGRAWDLLPMERYRAHNWQCFGNLGERQPYASIYTSLGCPYKCTFCCIQSPFHPEEYGNRYRMRKPYDVWEEIAYLHDEFGIKTFKIVDEMFVLNERHYTAICNHLIDSHLGDKINIWAYARIDTVKKRALAMLRKAGIRWLALGIESGSAHVRDGAKKALRTNDIITVVREIQAAGINVIGNYIFGLPDDDRISMQDTLNLAIECNTEFANFYSAMAYPGSKLYSDAVAQGLPLPRTWEGYSQHNYATHPLPTEKCQPWEVLWFRDYAFRKYFTNPKYLELVRNKFGEDTEGHLRRMIERPIARHLLETIDARTMGERVSDSPVLDGSSMRRMDDGIPPTGIPAAE